MLALKTREQLRILRVLVAEQPGLEFYAIVVEVRRQWLDIKLFHEMAAARPLETTADLCEAFVLEDIKLVDKTVETFNGLDVVSVQFSVGVLARGCSPLQMVANAGMAMFKPVFDSMSPSASFCSSP